MGKSSSFDIKLRVVSEDSSKRVTVFPLKVSNSINRAVLQSSSISIKYARRPSFDHQPIFVAKKPYILLRPVGILR